jgi:hypothetical protein
VGLKLNGTYPLLTHADYVNILGDNTDIKNTGASIDASKKVGLEVNTENN